MTAIIYKYPIYVQDRQTLLVPKDARILYAGYQDDRIYVWCLVEPENEMETRVIRLHGTGRPIENIERLTYISTCVSNSVFYVGHVFEER